MSLKLYFIGNHFSIHIALQQGVIPFAFEDVKIYATFSDVTGINELVYPNVFNWVVLMRSGLYYYKVIARIVRYNGGILKDV